MNACGEKNGEAVGYNSLKRIANHYKHERCGFRPHYLFRLNFEHRIVSFGNQDDVT